MSERRFYRRCFVLGLLLLSAQAASAEDQVQLRGGEMGFLPFLEMISEKLDLQIDASGLDGPSHLGTVSVPEAGPVSVERARAIALTVLHLEGYTWIHDPATGLYRIARQRYARDQELPLITDIKDLEDSDLLVTFFLPIRNTIPEHVARVLRSFMPGNSRIIPSDGLAAVLITDTARNIAKLHSLIQRLDTPEAAKHAKAWIEEQAEKAAAECPGSASEPRASSNPTMIALFSLIALVIGFLARGYVIRRIEGGL